MCVEAGLLLWRRGKEGRQAVALRNLAAVEAGRKERRKACVYGSM